MTRTQLLSGAAALALAPAQAAAQDAFLLDEIVISASVEAADAASTGTTVTVIGSEELSAGGETRLVDVLARVPGTDAITRGPVGTVSGLSIRGASQNYVKVLVDGIDVTDPSAPQTAFNFGLMTTGDISRIEILRGAQSALYGSSAVAGVVNVTTRRPDQDGVSQSAELEVGSYETVRGSYGYAVRNERLSFAATLAHIRTDGFSAADENDGNTEADGFEATRLSFSGDYRLDTGTLIGFSAFYEDATGAYDEDFPLEDGSPDEEAPSTSWGLRLFTEFATGSVDSTVALSLFGIDRANRGFDGGNTITENEGARVALGYTGGVDLGAGRLNFGADLQRETLKSDSDFFGFTSSASEERTSAGIFAEYAWAVSEDIDLVATGRWDEPSDSEGFFSGRLAAAWRPSDDLILRASVATGARAPSLYEIANSGANDLENEQTRSLDLGIEKRIGADSAVRATLFWSETENLIDYAFPDYFQFDGRVERRGLEIEGDFRLSDRARLGLAYTFTEGDNDAGISAGNTWNTLFPRHDLAVTLSGDITDRISGALTVQHVAGREGLDNYTLANAAVSYAMSGGTELYLRVENLTDEEYQQRAGYGTSDRAVYGGLRARF